eukprot:GHVU01041774.1.p1 GENE.GHVU01041774.1~~GHVU01041774.1.p1  ORF type:complete len:277 (+),score=33.63 GHVU01041774.1:276-1106(+)
MLSRAVVVLVLLSLGSAIADDAVAAPAAAPAAAQAAPPAAAAPPAPPTSANATGSGRQADETSKVVDRVQLMRHSFESPLTFDNNLAEWDMAMSTVPAKLHVVLAPAVANRTGQLWNKTPLRTANFELYMNFTMTGPTASTTTDGFALWYVSKSYAESFPKSPAEQQAWSLFGYQSAFKGLGVFFSNHDRQGKVPPASPMMPKPVAVIKSISPPVGCVRWSRQIDSSHNIQTFTCESTQLIFPLSLTHSLAHSLAHSPTHSLGCVSGCGCYASDGV